jgi:uncharacterized protein YjbI with pentapeptide repeats
MTERDTHDGEHFKGLEPGDLAFEGASFIDCTFELCNFSDVSLRGAHFSDCRFEQCELALINLTDAVFQEVTFSTSRLTGVNFSVLQQGALGVLAQFEDSDLSFCTFRSMDLTACSFVNCVLREASIMHCELERVSFAGSDFERCVVQDNNLMHSDLRGARNYLFSATSNRVRGMQVELPEAVNLLAALGVVIH